MAPQSFALTAPARLAGHAACVAAGLLCWQASAYAEGADLFTLNAAAAVVHDSNLYRLPPNANLPALIGSDSAADQIAITSLGIKLSKDYSLQHLELDLNLGDYRYQNFSHLNNTTKNYSAAWRWSYTPRLRGSLSTDRKETLNDFSDVLGYEQRNLRTNVTSRLDGAYEIDGNWRVVAAASDVSLTAPATRNADTLMRGVEVGLRYVYLSYSQWGYVLRSYHGSYRFAIPQANGLTEEQFDQINHDVTLRWALNENSTARFLVTSLQRTHPRVAQLDFNGLGGSATLSHKFSGKTSVELGWTRDIESYQTTTSNHTRTDRISIAPALQISAHTQLRLRHERVQRDYLGTGSAMTATSIQRKEDQQETSLMLDWQPRSRITLSAAVQDTRRSANLAGLDFQSTTTSLSAQISF